MTQLFSAEPGAHEKMEQLKQRLLPQVKDLPDEDLVKHIVHAGSQKGCRVFRTPDDVFVQYPLPGSGFVTFNRDMCIPYSAKAHAELMARWEKDLKARCDTSDAVANAFKATCRRTQEPPVKVSRPVRSSRSGRNMKESAQAEDEDEDMSTLITTGRESVLRLYKVSAATKRKYQVDSLTAIGAESIHNCSHKWYGELYGAVISDEVELQDVYIGQTVLELQTPTEWRSLGFPHVMRSHLVAVEAGDEDESGNSVSEPEVLLDFSLFHDDYKVEVYTWEQLVEMGGVILPHLTVTEKYAVVYTDGSGVKTVLSRDEYMAGFEAPRNVAFETIPLRMEAE